MLIKLMLAAIASLVVLLRQMYIRETSKIPANKRRFFSGLHTLMRAF